MTAKPEHVVRAREIRKVYHEDGAAVEALRGVSLEVHRGEFIALTGPSGCGKTTLLNIIACVDRPSAGSIFIDGIDVAGTSDEALTRVRRDRIGYVFQFFNLLPALSVAENIGLPLVLAGVGRREADDAVRDALVRVGMPGLGSRVPSALSGGQQQRAAIARAVVHRPTIVLADEPTGNLDTATGKEILELLRALSSTAGTAVLMATHSPDAASFADRVVAMRDGAIVG